MHLMLIGAITMAHLVVSLFFLRFWRQTQDRFFLFFAISFGVAGMERLAMGLTNYTEASPLLYLLRLFAYLLILFAIWDKNCQRKPKGLDGAKETGAAGGI